jgi:hypothetical protein
VLVLMIPSLNLFVILIALFSNSVPGLLVCGCYLFFYEMVYNLGFMHTAL